MHVAEMRMMWNNSLRWDFKCFVRERTSIEDIDNNLREREQNEIIWSPCENG